MGTSTNPSDVVYDSADVALDHIRASVPPNPLGIKDSTVQYEWIDWGDDDGGRIMPSMNSPFISPFLYRGQIKRYSPCVPSVYRGMRWANHPSLLCDRDRDAYLLAQMRLSEFLTVLESHPSVQHAREIGLHLGKMALAQHYGIPTDRLDLTQDPEVAAFFATCFLDKGQWHPHPDGGEGIIYAFHYMSIPKELVHEVHQEVLEMIGLQTFPRPGEQKAWTVKMPLGFDFERLPMTVYRFRHRLKTSQDYCDKCDAGRRLFPPDVLADVAETISAATTVPMSAAMDVLLAQRCPVMRLAEAILHYRDMFRTEFAVDISDREALKLTPVQLDAARKTLAQTRDSFLSTVGVRGVYTDDVDALIEDLAKKDHRPWGHFRRVVAAMRLGKVGVQSDRALSALKAALNDEHPDVRSAAEEAIRLIEGACHK